MRRAFRVEFYSHREEVRLHAVDLLNLGFLHVGIAHLGLLFHADIVERESAPHQCGKTYKVYNVREGGEIERCLDNDGKRAFRTFIPVAVAGVCPYVQLVGARTEQITIEPAFGTYTAPFLINAIHLYLILYALHILGHHYTILDVERVRLFVGECDAVGIVDLRAYLIVYKQFLEMHIHVPGLGVHLFGLEGYQTVEGTHQHASVGGQIG